MSEEKNCPHGVTLKSYRFDAMVTPYAQTVVKQFMCTHAEGCPGCLLDRVANLRAAMDTLLLSVDAPTDARRLDYERAIDLFWTDLKTWLGPEYQRVRRPAAGGGD